MINIPNQVLEAINLLEKDGFEAFAVGACIRDLLLGENPLDFDIITNASVSDIQFTFRNYRITDDRIKQGELLVTMLGMIIQISPYRSEVVGNRVVWAEDVNTDLARRGFSMNAIAYNPRRGFLDPYSGRECVNSTKRIISAIGEIKTVTEKQNGKSVTVAVYDMSRSFAIEPVRILSVIRYAAERDFTVDSATKTAMLENLSCLDYCDKELIRAELDRIIMGKFAAYALEEFTAVLEYIMPEITSCIGFQQLSRYHSYDVWTHTFKSVGYSSPVLAVRYAMLFHDLGKPDCFFTDEKNTGHFWGHNERSRLLAEGIMRRLGFERSLSEQISWLVYHHDVKIPDSRRELKILMRDLGAEDAKTLIMCRIADTRAKAPELEPQVEAYRRTLEMLSEIVAQNECYDIYQLAVTKKDLYDRRLVNNEATAQALINMLYELVLEKPIFNTKIHLLDIAQKTIEKSLEKTQKKDETSAKIAAPKSRLDEPVFKRKKP